MTRLHGPASKYKACEAWHTGLSPSLADLSRSFCSHRKFFTLCMEMAIHTGQTDNSFDRVLCLDCLLGHNPHLTFACPLIRYTAEVKKVWALPVSLATTPGIVVYFLFLEVLRCFSSPGFLHISYIFRYGYLGITPSEFPHSEIFGSKLVWQLPEAFRSLLRPSSVSYVKASIVCA